MNRLKLAATLYIASVIGLFFYSFTQVDLSLTLSKASFFQTLQKSFQHIGWFDRPLSTFLFLIIFLTFCSSYLYLLYLSHIGKITRKFFWSILLASCILLVLSYNAFSYDIFNNIFDAKIITHYHQNPYLHKALDFPNEPMLSFMRWTHRTYPYGPLWLAFAVPLSYLGANIFLLTFFIFKIAVAGVFLATVFAMEKILEISKHPNKVFALVLFALNPLVMVENLVSSHNDILMILLAILGIYFFLKKNFAASVALVIGSYFVKSVSIVILAPILMAQLALMIKKTISEQKFFALCVLFSFLALIYAVYRLGGFQPWYFLWVLPFIALLKPNRYIITGAIVFSLGLLFTYVIYVSQGNYKDIKAVYIYIVAGSLAIGFFGPTAEAFLNRLKLKSA